MSGGGPTAAAQCPDCGRYIRPTGGARFKEHSFHPWAETRPCPSSGKEFPRRWKLETDHYPEGMVGKPYMAYDCGDIQVWYNPAGLDTHPGKWSCDRKERTLFHDIRQATPGFSNANRIDKWTSGLLMAGNNAGASHLRKVWGDAHKSYACIIETPDWVEAGVDAPVAGGEAITGLRVIDANEAHALVEAKLIQSGRTHQIRRHLWELGYPIVDDDMFMSGPRLMRRAGQLLHCWKMEVPMPDGTIGHFESPVPDDMLLEGLSWD